MKRLTADALAVLHAEAVASPRRRKNFNLHASPDDPIQRLCNAFEPGTYVRPHRHGAGVWELFLVIGGHAVALAPNTVLFEVKPGPYRPTGENDFAAWAPKEDAPGAAAFVEWMAHAAVGARAPATA